jgi:ABC-type dipeptide/oligopeptide/nickel transport system permease component
MTDLAFVLGKIFGTYFMMYPIIYFAWNFAIEGAGFSQYKIPGFWIGMAFFLVFNIAFNTLKTLFKSKN